MTDHRYALNGEINIMCAEQTHAYASDEDEDVGDEALLQRVCLKDAQAFEALYDRHANLVLRVLLGITRDPAAAEELLQDTFWQVWQRAGQYHASGSVRGWLLRIARNQALDWLRREKLRMRAEQLELDVLDRLPSHHHPSVEVQAGQSLLRQHISQVLHRLPVEQRLCLELAYFHDMSHSAIAAQTDAPLGTIKTRLRNGLAKLKRARWEIDY